MAVYYYLRVSHRASAVSMLSPEAQLKVCQDYHRLHLPKEPMGIIAKDGIPGVFYDRAVSAWKIKLANREQGGFMCQILQPGDHVLFYSIDRGFRNIGDWHATVSDWRARGISAHFITDNIDMTTAYGRARAAYIAIAAELYSDLASERIREANVIRKIRGQKARASTPKEQWGESEFDFTTTHTPEPASTKSGRVFMYERCSSNAQYISGLGMEVQAKANLEYAKFLAESRPGLELVEKPFADEAISAFTVDFGDRPAGKKLLAELRPGDHLVVYRIDRAWRSPKDAINMIDDFLKRNITVHFVRDRVEVAGAEGEQWVSMMSSFAKLESSIKSRRKLEINAQCKATGRPWNKIPVGYKAKKVDNVKRLVLDKKKTAWLAVAYVLTEERGYTISACDNIRRAIYFHKRDLAPSITGKTFYSSRDLKYLAKIRSQIPESAWEVVLKRARKIVDKPVPERFMKLCRYPQPWQGSCETARQPQVSF